MEPDEFESLKKQKRYLEDWLDRHKKAQQALPYVQANLELTEWQISAYENQPSEADEIPYVGLSPSYRQQYDQLVDSLPMLPDYEPIKFTNMVVNSTSGTASTFQYVARVGDLGTPAATAYASKYVDEYHVIQEAQHRTIETKRLLEKLGNESTVARFDRALQAITAVKSGIGERTAAAMEIRTLLDGVYGDLQAKARKSVKENKLSWEKLAERLVKQGTESLEHQQFVVQGKTFSFLKDTLSDIGKDREGSHLSNLSALWTQLLDHLFVVLSLVVENQ